MAAKKSAVKAVKAAKKASSSRKRSSSKKSEPKQTKQTEADKVRESAANPSASRVGAENVHASDDCPLKITVIEGARATLEVEDHGPLNQAQLQSAVKLLNQAIQETY